MVLLQALMLMVSGLVKLDGNIIVHSSMYFAYKPFELQDKAPVVQQDTNDNIALQSQN